MSTPTVAPGRAATCSLTLPRLHTHPNGLSPWSDQTHPGQDLIMPPVRAATGPHHANIPEAPEPFAQVVQQYLSQTHDVT